MEGYAQRLKENINAKSEEELDGLARARNELSISWQIVKDAQRVVDYIQEYLMDMIDGGCTEIFMRLSLYQINVLRKSYVFDKMTPFTGEVSYDDQVEGVFWKFYESLCQEGFEITFTKSSESYHPLVMHLKLKKT